MASIICDRCGRRDDNYGYCGQCIEELDGTIDDLEKQLEKQNEGYNKTIAELDNEIRELKQELEVADNTIAELNHEIRVLEQELDSK